MGHYDVQTPIPQVPNGSSDDFRPCLSTPQGGKDVWQEVRYGRHKEGLSMPLDMQPRHERSHPTECGQAVSSTD